MRAKNVIYSNIALNDLKSILRFYLPRNKKYVLETINHIEKQILIEFNNLGKKVFNSKLNQFLNVLIVKDFLIFYELKKESIYIHRIVNGKQDYENLI